MRHFSLCIYALLLCIPFVDYSVTAEAQGFKTNICPPVASHALET